MLVLIVLLFQSLAADMTRGLNGTHRSLILLISDGFGPASETIARNYLQSTQNLPEDHMLPLDEILVGLSRTRSSDSMITDSAAGATCFSCAIKTYNGAVGVDDDGSPCPTVLEAAKAGGMKTGLVATSRITHATPAAFASHVPDRNMENEIAYQEIVEVAPDLMFGGGLRHFIPQSEPGSSRNDDLDLVQMAVEKGYNVLYNRRDFDRLPVEGLPALGLFGLGHMRFELDRFPLLEPSLSEMSEKALNMLEKAAQTQQEGFFLMIEGSRIDHAAHANDLASHIKDILEYQSTVEVVKNYVDSHPDTVLISVSDHETGGLSIGFQGDPLLYPDYIWHPEVVERVKVSTEFLATQLIIWSVQNPIEMAPEHVEKVISDQLGIYDMTEEEISILIDLLYNFDNPAVQVVYQLGDLVNSRALIGWSSHGHSGVDVNLHAYGNGVSIQDLIGSRENTQVGRYLWDTLGLAPFRDQVMDELDGRERQLIPDTVNDDYHHITTSR
eukprot:Lithocolla_globosa_v1_NODE_2210_length_2108_cov_17.727228.p1 type:complete len:499 gc:universal NODE_2210_length_2108_cov_17.727228:2064-568(-)